MEYKIDEITIPEEMKIISPTANHSRCQTSGSSAENSTQKKLDFFSSIPNRSTHTGSWQDLRTKKRGKYAHVESKVKKFIADLPPPRHERNKFMRHRSMPDSVGFTDLDDEKSKPSNLAEFWKSKFDVLSQEHERINSELQEATQALQKKNEEAVVAQRLLEECQLGIQSRNTVGEEKSQKCQNVSVNANDDTATSDVHYRPIKRSKKHRIKRRLAKMFTCGKCSEVHEASYSELNHL